MLSFVSAAMLLPAGGKTAPACTMHTKPNWCIKDSPPDYSTTKTASAEECCSLCQNDTRCESWGFGHVGPSNLSSNIGGKCRLKNTTVTGEPGSARCAMAGSKKPWPGPPTPRPPSPQAPTRVPPPPSLTPSQSNLNASFSSGFASHSIDASKSIGAPLYFCGLISRS